MRIAPRVPAVRNLTAVRPRRGSHRIECRTVRSPTGPQCDFRHETALFETENGEENPRTSVDHASEYRTRQIAPVAPATQFQPVVSTEYETRQSCKLACSFSHSPGIRHPALRPMIWLTDGAKDEILTADMPHARHPSWGWPAIGASLGLPETETGSPYRCEKRKELNRAEIRAGSDQDGVLGL